MKKTSTKSIETTTTYELTGDEVIGALVKAKLILAEIKYEDVSIFVRVPTGGDYSGTILDLFEENVVVKIIKREKE